MDYVFEICGKPLKLSGKQILQSEEVIKSPMSALGQKRTQTSDLNRPKKAARSFAELPESNCEIFGLKLARCMSWRLN